ncbi:phosphate/phosphite/phosphonate ABC transporter substrate-binding protein [Pseudooceanicola algae]|uniref:Uncharacterized protein n=1 Tax=Pseudooceanicola algae TaxID=1537215 RepID=A0A418SJ80_9RHOB|nr:PhnD/SsuA/transferrin family substrate-binding protein [Pseudooceanicola algae]QPM90149.1 hypothetical protein PSAL_013840 [Pseudooceanicola algae]
MNGLIASFPMYDRPETAPVYDRLWSGIRDSLGEGPVQLTRDADLWAQWRSPDLLLSQTCGLPFRSRLKGRVTLVGTPDPGFPGLPSGQYQSALILRRDDPAREFAELDGAPFAYNDALSQSGWAALQTLCAAQGVMPGGLLETGSHAASARAVAAGQVRAAALDRHSWHLIDLFDDIARDLRVLCLTPPTPALPLITATTRDPERLRYAISAALTALSPDERALIGFHRLVRIPSDEYDQQPLPSPPASGTNSPE